MGTYPREVRRVGRRYLERGLAAALSDDPRPTPPQLLDAAQQAAIVAMVCGPPPLGHARWTIVLTAAEAQQRGVIRTVGRETIRRLFVGHALKPWRKKMWCVPKLDQEYLHRMEEVLDVLNQPRDEHAPVVALDERPVQVLGSVRPDRPMAPGQPARSDYEYARCGTANVFCVVEPQAGRHQTHATENRTAGQCAGALKRIALSYPEASTIHLVLDNLNTPQEKSLTATFGAEAGHQLWSRLTVHYTPKHGSWLNPAELEASLWSRQCLGRQRVATLTELRCRTSAWNRWANHTKIKIDWRFSTADARRVFHYQPIATHESKH